MSIRVPHAHMSAPWAYGGVNGVNFRFIAESFASV
jgi:hypothetical protein